MPGKVKYGVKFVGYAGYVVNRREVMYAMLDFITAAVWLHADCGQVRASRLVNLGPFLKRFPEVATELEARLREGAAPEHEQCAELASMRGTASDVVTLHVGEYLILLDRNADVNKFVRQLNKRFLEIEQVLEQAEQIGSRIARRPYCDYINEIAETGLARVEVHGYGLFIDGTLKFQPSPQVFLTKQREPRRFELQEVVPSTPQKTRAN
jgi:hypothetical protein